MADSDTEGIEVAQVDTPDEPEDVDNTTGRSQLRLGLRSARPPVNSHRNRFEAEYNYVNIGPKRSRRYDGVTPRRVKRPRSAQIKEGSMSEFVHVIFTQLAKNNKYDQKSVNKGIRKHGELVLDALLKEFGQIHKHDTFILQMVKDLTPE